MNAPNHADIHRDLGKVEAGLEALKDMVKQGFSDTNDRLEKLETRMAAMETKESERKGAFQLGHWLVGAISAFGAFIASHFLK